MEQEQYLTLFYNLAEYRAPDGTIVQAIWDGQWFLVPDNPSDPNAEHWQYAVESSGAIVVCHYTGRIEPEPPRPPGKAAYLLPDDLRPKARSIEIGATDLTVADFVKVE
jgi:hypothetical protein